MSRRSPLKTTLRFALGLTVAGQLMPVLPAYAGAASEAPQPKITENVCGSGGHGGYGTKNTYFNKKVIINKPVNIFKKVEINKNIDLSKKININKNIDLSKNIYINKKIIINKGGKGGGKAEAEASAEAWAEAMASAFAEASATATSSAFARGGSTFVTFGGGGGQGDFVLDVEAEAEAEACVEQWATLVRAVHAECVSHSARRHPAIRMRPETWIDSSLSSEIYRCLEGSWLEVVVGEVVESDKGMAGVYEGGERLVCRPGEALRHFKDGMVKCAVAEPVIECTERTNLRRWGAGDVFFTYQAKVCARIVGVSRGYQQKTIKEETYSEATGEVRLSGYGLDGGVGAAP